ncbi:DNA gyrase inhibitor YacG [Cellvibrio polysaccharolyticus]|uniref:DNA gyrase inhibitor YacG n=1 Tax=Cellvibrio polysaccharolyticus TaxID=2082724 RepID=A0A928YVC2_9GAMM|nr:DNA gyrase inhibitor YacG [Cellvibrio polysaccharolyticus]MBE8718395.1 DNA gyrase inhibitor YacG [Cellvibrio polysaccharolyticus]
MTTPTNPDVLQLNCPICKKIVLWNDDFPFRPFCSDRCRLIDLGDWASESHRIAGDPVIPDEE